MRFDALLAGVGGQGILSAATLVAGAAAGRGWQVKQSEVHGMAQRGGAVVAHLRVADAPIHSDLIPRGRADLILALEPLESLRYLEYLSPAGIIATADEPVRNIDDYPDLDELLKAIRSTKRAILVPATTLAKQAGDVRSANLVMVGAVAHLLPLAEADLINQIRRSFPEGRIRAANLEAFRLGRSTGSASP